MTYTSTIGQGHLGDEPLGPCFASLGRGLFVPAPYSQAKGLTSLALRGTTVESSPSLGTSGAVADSPAPASTLGTTVDPPTPTDS